MLNVRLLGRRMYVLLQDVNESRAESLRII